MKFIRYINLFEKISRVRTQHCFMHNSYIIFLVSPNLVSRAIGESGNNVKKLSKILGKKIKIIEIPRGIEDAKRFISSIVAPAVFKDLEVKENEIIINAGSQSKAALIGRDKCRLCELKEIVKSYFGKEVRIV